MNSLLIEQIISTIEKLPSKEALTFLVVNKIYDYSKEGYSKIKEVIKSKQNEKKFAFVPNKEEAKILNRLSSNPEYKQVVLLIPESNILI